MEDLRKKLLQVAIRNEQEIIELESIIKKYIESGVVIPDSITEAVYRCQITASNIVLLLEDKC